MGAFASDISVRWTDRPTDRPLNLRGNLARPGHYILHMRNPVLPIS